MKKKRFAEPEIFKILKEAESGMKMSDLLRKYNITSPTFYRWRSKYGGMELNDLKRMKELEKENSQLKKIVAQQALEIHAIKEVIKKNL